MWLLAQLLVLLLAATTSLADNLQVTCGSVIKLQHVKSKFRLHSHEVAYSGGSQQQSVTAYPSGEDANSYWTIHGTEEACPPGTLIRKNTQIRLQHVATRRWLHSHEYYSPISRNQEVSAFGSDEASDEGDWWAVEWDGKGKVWKQETKVRLRHVATDKLLYSNEYTFSHPINGQREVSTVHFKDKFGEWQTAEGVYFPHEKPSANEVKAEDVKEEL